MENKKKIWIIATVILLVLILGIWFLKKKTKVAVTPVENKSSVINTTTADGNNDEVKKANKILDDALTKARTADQDLDGLSDIDEAKYGTNPSNPDTDGDGLLDGEEVIKYHTNPLKADTDGDGFKDGYEVRGGYNPLGKGRL